MNRIIFVAIMFSMLTFAVSCGGNATKNKENAKSEAVAQSYYTCSMHHEVHSDKPGKCPKCGMELIKKDGEPSDTMRMDSDAGGEEKK